MEEVDEGGLFGGGEAGDEGGHGFAAVVAEGGEDLGAGRGEGDEGGAAVVGIGVTGDQAGGLEVVDDRGGRAGPSLDARRCRRTMPSSRAAICSAESSGACTTRA